MSSLTHSNSFASSRCLALIAALCAAVFLTACEAWEHDDRDETISYGELPAAVQRTIDANLQGGAIDQIDVSRENGRIVYDVQTTGPNGEIEFSVAQDGAFLGIDTEDDDEDEDADDDEDEDEDEDDDDDDDDEDEDEDEDEEDEGV